MEIPEGYTEFQLADVLSTGLNLVNLVTSLSGASSGEK
jgi:hypothetical protein